METFERLFQALRINEEAFQNEIVRRAVVEEVPKNKLVVEQGKYIKWLALVMDGEVRVWQENETRQILLYYVQPVQTCILSLSAVFKDYKSVINAVTETDSLLIKIPVRFISEWCFLYKSWNQFTTNAFISGYEDLLSSFTNLAFKKIDERVLDYLKLRKIKEKSSLISLSHNDLAKEIGTTREVISKTLKKLETEGTVRRHFKKIELLSQ